MKIFKRILLFMLILAGLSGVIYLKIEMNKLQQAHDGLARQLAAAENKVGQFQERYKQQKALEANLLRTKLALEGRIGKMQAEIKMIEEENQLLKQDKNAIVKRLTAERAQLQDQYQSLLQQAKTLSAELAAEREQFRETVKVHEQQFSQFRAQVKSLESGLSRTNFQLERCVDHNRKLAEISEDLLFQYENKGFLSSFKQSEPFTQLGRIEMEQMIQEYTDKIEKEKIVQ